MDTHSGTPVANRDQLIYLLTEAAEVEHCLMCCYLYAAFSLKQSTDEDLSAEELAEVERWRGAIVGVAIDEMLHLALVSNLLVAIGSKPHFQRQNFPVPAGAFPGGLVAMLAPFDADTLDHFIFLERPESEQLADADTFGHGGYKRLFNADQLMAGAQDYTTVGGLYHTIAESIRALSARIGEAQLFIGRDASQLDTQSTGLWDLPRVRCTKTALDAIEMIVRQGEGSPGKTEDSHFQRFIAIRERMRALQAANPAFKPARPTARNPVMRKPPTPDGKIFIDDAKAAPLMDLCNAVYGTMLRGLAASYANQDAPCNAALAKTAIALMRVLVPLAQRLTQLPASASAPGCNAGMSFAMSRYPLDYATPHFAVLAIAERLREIAVRLPAASQLPEAESARLAGILHESARAILDAPATVRSAHLTGTSAATME